MDEQVIRLICLQIKRLQNKRLLFSLRKTKQKNTKPKLFSHICTLCCKKIKNNEIILQFSVQLCLENSVFLLENNKRQCVKPRKSILDCIFRSHLTSGKTYTLFKLSVSSLKRKIYHIVRRGHILTATSSPCQLMSKY